VNVPDANISASGRLFEAAMENLTPRAKATLTLIRESCDRIKKLGGVISQANVAREIEERTSRLIGQTIRNTGTYRIYINQRAQEGKTENLQKSLGAKEYDRKVVIADEVVLAYVEVLEAEAVHLRKTNALLRKGVAKLRPMQPADIALILGESAVMSEDQSKRHDLEAVLTKEAVKSIAAFLSPAHLGRFHCRTADDEIVSSTEATLMGRAGVRALTAIVKRYSAEEAVLKA
jgi:hypothetical protein